MHPVVDAKIKQGESRCDINAQWTAEVLVDSLFEMIWQIETALADIWRQVSHETWRVVVGTAQLADGTAYTGRGQLASETRTRQANSW